MLVGKGQGARGRRQHGMQLLQAPGATLHLCTVRTALAPGLLQADPLGDLNTELERALGRLVKEKYGTGGWGGGGAGLGHGIVWGCMCPRSLPTSSASRWGSA